MKIDGEDIHLEDPAGKLPIRQAYSGSYWIRFQGARSTRFRELFRSNAPVPGCLSHPEVGSH